VKFSADLDEGRGHIAFQCDDENNCGARWWATRLDAGIVRDQLLAAFEGETAIVDRLMVEYDLPLTIERTMWWQIWLTGNEFHHYVQDRGKPNRSLNLLRRLLRRAS
jgi:hypothetical protein